MNNSYIKSSLAIVAGIGLVFPIYSLAANQGSRLIEEVMVTAQKREEDSQDIPIMISAFSSEKLDAMGVESTADLQKVTPGLTFTYAYGYTVIYLRGVGSDAFLPNADPSIATYIDGINIGPSQGKQDTLGAVKRVEVLKGPQGTLFGRNATGGAISIITEDPPEEFGGYFKTEFGNYNARQNQLYLGLPIGDSLGATVSLFESYQDLYGRNEVYGEPGPMRDEFAEGARVKLRWDPADSFAMTLIAAYGNQFSSNSLSQENTRPSPLLGGGVEPDELDRVWHNNDLGGNSTMNELYGGIFEWHPGPVDLKFIYSENYAIVDEAHYDLDSTEKAEAYFYSADQFNDQKTYELQILSNEDTWLSDDIEWVAGLYRLEGEGGFGSLYLTLNAAGVASALLGLPDFLAPILGPILNSTPDIVLGNGGILTTESNSAYAQATWFTTNWLNVTAGVRYQEEVRGITNSYLDVVSPLAGDPPNEYYKSGDRSQNTRISDFTAPDLEENTVSPRIAVQIFPTENIQLFASAQRGYKSPTYNIVNFFTNPDPVEREEATAFELGIKTDLLDGTLRLNGALFKTEIDGLLTALVAIPSGGVVTFKNAGTGEIEGAEIDFQWQPMPSWNPGLVFTGGATYLDAIYSEYKDGAGFDDDTGLYFGSDSLVGDTSRDFSGNKIVRTPRFSSSVSANQFVSMGDFGDLEFGVDYYYNSGYNTTPQNSPFYEQSQFETWAARISYFYDPLGLQLTGFVNNAKDEEYTQAMVQQDFGRTVTLAPPRTYGLRLKWEFGG
ncbi:TonB-dependent receptor [Zhongshania sp.]|jgi:iron complex outermembrane receptor protein|uniref:TonB-dependent receptor n=1 Tax=Zhongshania sp. TaxID=1971902 RepID=UPI002A8235FA|nr:TonB-dependent receptor [Zhongshania sp.]